MSNKIKPFIAKARRFLCTMFAIVDWSHKMILIYNSRWAVIIVQKLSMIESNKNNDGNSHW
jgi:hypothetical protein